MKTPSTENSKNHSTTTRKDRKEWLINFIGFIFVVFILGLSISTAFVGFAVITLFAINLFPAVASHFAGIAWNVPLIHAFSVILVGSVATAISWSTNKNRSKEAVNTEFCNQIQWALDHMSDGEDELRYRYATSIIYNYANNPPKHLLNDYKKIASELVDALENQETT